MNSSWIVVVGTLGGVLVGGLLEQMRSLRTFRREKAWERSNDRRQHLEAAYMAIEELREAYGQALGEALHLLNFGSAAPQLYPSARVPWARIRMLVRLYVPELRSYLATVESAGPEFGRAAAAAITQSSTDSIGNQALARNVLTANGLLQQAIDQFTSAIAMVSERLDFEALSAIGQQKKPSFKGQSAR